MALILDFIDASGIALVIASESCAEQVCRWKDRLNASIDGRLEKMHLGGSFFYWQTHGLPAWCAIMAEQIENFVPLGTHLVMVEGDTVELIARGVVMAEDMRVLLDHFAQVKREHQRLFVLYDARQGTGVDRGARKLPTVTHAEEAHAQLQVIFGLSFPVRVVLNMILRAQQLLLNRTVTLHVFETENEARAFFDKERARLRNTSISKTSN